MNPEFIAEDFVRRTSECLDELFVRFSGMRRETIWTGLALIPKLGAPPVRSGTLAGVGTFEIHGRGCCFVDLEGAVLDVDWDSKGMAVFDSWRVRMFAKSVGHSSIDQLALRDALAKIEGIEQVADDTFTWADRRYNAIRT